MNKHIASKHSAQSFSTHFCLTKCAPRLLAIVSKCCCFIICVHHIVNRKPQIHHIDRLCCFHRKWRCVCIENGASSSIISCIKHNPSNYHGSSVSFFRVCLCFSSIVCVAPIVRCPYVEFRLKSLQSENDGDFVLLKTI